MDPLSVLGIVTGLITTCTKVASGLQSMVGRYQQANVQISSICAECSIIRISLSQVEHLLNSTPETTPPRNLEERLGPCLDAALAGCSLVLLALEEELRKFGVDLDSDARLNRRARTTYAWDSSRMKDLLDALRGQQSAVTLLFVLLQTNSVNEMQAILRARHNSLHSITTQTRSLRALYPDSAARAASIIESVTESDSIFGDVYGEGFASDNDLTDSGPYRRLGIQDMTLLNGHNAVQNGLAMTIRGTQHLQRAQPRQNSLQEVEVQRTAIMAANQLRNNIVNEDSSNVAALLRQGVDISGSYEYCGQTITLLHSAASTGNAETVKLLLAYNHSINVTTPEMGTTPLHVAVIKDHPAVVRLLLECGADIECKMIKQLALGQQPISATVAPNSNDGQVHHQKLISDWTGFRPLHCAAVYNRPECARHLLEFGASVDSQTAQNLNTPLHLSTVFGNSDVSEVLLKYGANRMAKDNSNFTVFRLGRVTLISSLLELGTRLYIISLNPQLHTITLAIPN